MPEPAEVAGDGTPDLATQAAEDQALASARHIGECTVRFFNVLNGGGIPGDLSADLCRIWLRWFIEDNEAEDE